MIDCLLDLLPESHWCTYVRSVTHRRVGDQQDLPTCEPLSTPQRGFPTRAGGPQNLPQTQRGTRGLRISRRHPGIELGDSPVVLEKEWKSQGQEEAGRGEDEACSCFILYFLDFWTSRKF